MNAEYAKIPFEDKTICKMMHHISKSTKHELDWSICFSTQSSKFQFHLKEMKNTLMRMDINLSNPIYNCIACVEYSIAVFGIYID